jgi:predicted nucleotidyltransferase
MNPLLERCHWPDLPDKYNLALREAVGWVLDRFQDVSGIIATGSILRGNPDRASDLDICVIQRAAFRQRLQKFFNGVPAEIFVNPPAALERYLVEEHQARRPITAHMLATGSVILELDPSVAALRQKAGEVLAHPPAAPADLTQARYLIAALYEDALDVVERDPATGHLLLCQAVVEMLKFQFTARGEFFPRSKELLAALAGRDAELAGRARQFFGAATLAEQLSWAEQIADQTIQARGFFEWESAPEEVVA